MKKKIPFLGTGTALITPFREGEVDYRALEGLIERQIEAKIPALIIGGTTGEAATLSDEERYGVYRFAIEQASGRTKIILGAGTNDTRVAIRHTEAAEMLGADGILVVTPYYNKGTERGTAEHYRAIASATSLPVILYNVPSRTGVNLSLGLLRELSEIDNIVALKEAGDSLDRLVELSTLGDDMYLYSGNDTQIFPTLSLGGVGVISVASNLFPREIEQISALYFAGEHERARELQKALLPLIHALFWETNPTPVKYAAWRMGLCENELRLPLAPLSRGHEEKLDSLLENANAILEKY